MVRAEWKDRRKLNYLWANSRKQFYNPFNRGSCTANLEEFVVRGPPRHTKRHIVCFRGYTVTITIVSIGTMFSGREKTLQCSTIVAAMTEFCSVFTY